MNVTLRIWMTSWVVLGGLFDVAPTLVVAATRHADYGIRSATRDKTGTSACQKYTSGPQLQARKQLGNRVSLEAEGMGFEPTTPCGAPDFESDLDMCPLCPRSPNVRTCFTFGRGRVSTNVRNVRHGSAYWLQIGYKSA
jgi:hypothetical protein